MPKKCTPRTPQLCRHFDGRAYVRIKGRFHYLGRHGTPEATQRYHALLAQLAATGAKLPDTLRAMVDLQLACGARSGEIFELHPCDIDRSGPVWTATIGRHKTAHRGKARVLYLGPKAQAILRPFMVNRGPADYLFSPKEAVQQRKQESETHRRPNQLASPRKTDRTVGDRYDTHSYRRVIARAVAAAIDGIDADGIELNGMRTLGL